MKDLEPSIDLYTGLPTPTEVAIQLQASFSQDQAEAIAELVYQPLRETLIKHIIRSLKWYEL